MVRLLPLEIEPTHLCGGVSTFRTDADISANFATHERVLQRWQPSPDVPYAALDDMGKTDFDQFATNEQRFGVKSNYDERFYTTAIDRNDPNYAEKAARAERIAREIETSSALTSHVNEERGHILPEGKGMDEESKCVSSAVSVLF